ncbi:MAG: family 16 glycosylhydrolase [Akkermansia sp.]
MDRTYGFYEASIEFTGDRNASSGMWSAFWLQSDTISTVGNTGKYGTEIDIVEYRPNPANGYETNQAIHYHGYGEHHKSAAKQHKIGLLEGYHTYGVLRTAGGYTFYMDGKEVWKTQEALSCIPEYIILSSEIRDKNWAGDIPANGYGSRDKSPTAMNVDYVRVYSLPDSYRTAPDGKWSDRQWKPSCLPAGKSPGWRPRTEPTSGSTGKGQAACFWTETPSWTPSPSGKENSSTWKAGIKRWSYGAESPRWKEWIWSLTRKWRLKAAMSPGLCLNPIPPCAPTAPYTEKAA